MTLPTGYTKALLYNLAVELSLAPQFVKQPLDPQVLRIARETLARVKALNTQIPRLASDAPSFASGGTGALSASDFDSGNF